MTSTMKEIILIFSLEKGKRIGSKVTQITAGGKRGNAENCNEIRLERFYFINDASCDATMPFICVAEDNKIGTG